MHQWIGLLNIWILTQWKKESSFSLSYPPFWIEVCWIFKCWLNGKRNPLFHWVNQHIGLNWSLWNIFWGAFSCLMMVSFLSINDFVHQWIGSMLQPSSPKTHSYLSFFEVDSKVTYIVDYKILEYSPFHIPHSNSNEYCSLYIELPTF